MGGAGFGGQGRGAAAAMGGMADPLAAMMRRAGMTGVRVQNLLFGTMAINYGERAAN